MKAAKRRQYFFLVTFIFVILTVGVFWGAANSFIKLQPPSEGIWEISGQELIDYDVILNGSVDIASGGELTISNANVWFESNSTHSLTIDVYGSLIIENSNISVTNLNYNFTIAGKGNSDITITDSRLENARVTLLSCDFIAERTVFDNHKLFTAYYLDAFIITEVTFQNSQTGVYLQDCDYAILTNNVFSQVEYGIEMSGLDNATFTNNLFQDIPTIGIHSLIVEATYVTDNDFINVTTGIHVEDRRIEVISNRFDQNDVALFLDNSDNSIVFNNNFTEIIETGIELSLSRYVDMIENNFVDSAICIDGFASTDAFAFNNTFDNVVEGIMFAESDRLEVENNLFLNIIEIGIEITDSWDDVVSDNEFNNATIAINVVRGRRNIIQSNNLFQVDEGIGIISSREMEILGNIIEETVTGIYVEQTKDTIITANGAIKATYGITLWSVSDVTLASNGVFDSVYGFSIWFSEDVELLGNEVNTSDIGIIARNSFKLQIKDGSLKSLDLGIQVIGCPNPIIRGNTFDEIVGAAIVLKDSSGFLVYQNNFEDVGAYGDIIDCLGVYYRVIDDETAYGNYYKNEPATEPVFIDTVGTTDIYDNHPLSSPYIVKPTIEFVTRDISDPTDLDDVNIETQIFVPQGVDLIVYLEYMGNYDEDWISLDITASEDPVGQIGAINRYSGIIPAYPYDYTIIYRVKVEYQELGSPVYVITDNDTYTVLESAETPVIIRSPQVLLETEDEEGVITYIPVTTFYQDENYVVSVEIINNTDIDRLAGNRHVNLTWTEINTLTNETESASVIMYYNETADNNIYTFAFDQGYDAGMLINFYISVVDANGTLHRTVTNSTMIILAPPEETAFDTITLLSIGATLLVIQALVILRRRRKNKEE